MKRRKSRPRSVAMAGLVASSFLHVILLIPLLLGFGDHPQRHQPRTEGASASRQREALQDGMTAVFMDDDPAIATSREADASISKFRLPHRALRPVVLTRLAVAQMNFAQDEAAGRATEASGDQSGHSLLFGRYMGQISARVERAWLRPRSVPEEGAFACRVQITQDRSGNVMEVMLQRCTADVGWQASLVRAIGSASPLPAPPDDAVFSNVVILEFDSESYVKGGSEQGFEPVARTVAPLAALSEAVTSNTLATTPMPGKVTRRLRPDGSVDLTIVGRRAAEEPHP